MLPHLRSASLPLALALSLAVPAFVADAAAPQSRDLSGSWSFNEDLTARLREEARRSHEDAGGGFDGAGRRRRPGDGSPDGGGRRKRGGATPRPGEAPMHEEALDELSIVQAADTLTLTGPAGRQRVLRTDGRKTRDEGASGGPAELKASWSPGGSLIVEVKPKRGQKRTEIYAVSTDRQHLFLTVLVGKDRGLKIVRAYDAAPPPGAPTNPPARQLDRM
jgi:hypothetical protein